MCFCKFFWPIHKFYFRKKSYQLPLMSVIFSATKASYNISGLAGLAIFNPGFSLMVKMHIMTEDIFFVILFRSKYFCIRAGDTKKRSFFNHFHNPHFAHAEHQRHQKTFFGHHILHNPYNWNILFFLFFTSCTKAGLNNGPTS